MNNAVHIVERDKSLICNNCGQSYEPKLPIEVSKYIEATGGFYEKHRSCKKEKT